MIKKLVCNIYQADVWLIVGRDDLEKFYKRKKITGETMSADRLQGFVQSIDITDKPGIVFRDYVIYLEDKRNFYTLLHESTHLVNHILRDRNAYYDWHNDETFAYYQTYWFKRIWRIINKDNNV